MDRRPRIEAASMTAMGFNLSGTVIIKHQHKTKRVNSAPFTKDVPQRGSNAAVGLTDTHFLQRLCLLL
jgi:hypothetical protein